MNILTYHFNYFLICVKFKLINGKYQCCAKVRKRKMECNGCRVGLGNFGLFGKVVAPFAVNNTPYYINPRMSD